MPTKLTFLFAFIILLIGVVFFIPFANISDEWWVNICKNQFCGLHSTQAYTFFWVLSSILIGNLTWSAYVFYPTDIVVSPLFYLLIPISYLASWVLLLFAQLLTKNNKNKKYKK